MKSKEKKNRLAVSLLQCNIARKLRESAHILSSQSVPARGTPEWEVWWRDVSLPLKCAFLDFNNLHGLAASLKGES